MPAVARTYDTAMAATVTTTTGDATLSVVDPDTSTRASSSTGRFALPSALQIRAANAAQTNPAYAAVSGTPLTVLSYAGPTTSDAVTLGLRQAIGATDVLRSGSYGKTLTFTLSTTAHR